MKKIKGVLALSCCFLLLLLAAAGCGLVDDVDEVEEVEKVLLDGNVAINRQGEGSAEGIVVKVEGEDEVIEIDNERGDFTLELEPDRYYDIYATREDLAVSKVQNFYLDSDHLPDKLLMLIMPLSREQASEESGESEELVNAAPKLVVSGIEDFAYADRLEEIITISSDRPIYQIHVTLNNSFQKEVAARGFWDWEIVIEDLILPINYGGPSQQLAFFIVDRDNNITTEYFQVVMPEEVPGNLPVPPDRIEVQAETHNSSLTLLGNLEKREGFEMPEEEKADIQAMPEDTMLLSALEWAVDDPYAEIDSFNIYRSFTEDDYAFLDTVAAEKAYDEEEDESYLAGNYLDIDTALEPGQEVYYKITSVNSRGESVENIKISVVPLPVFEVTLLGPEGADTGVDPELQWYSDSFEDLSWQEQAELYFLFELVVKDQNVSYDTLRDPLYGWKDAEVWGLPSFSVRFSEAFEEDQLRRGQKYQWNLETAGALRVLQEEDDKTSLALSFAAGPYYSRAENSSLEFSTKD